MKLQTLCALLGCATTVFARISRDGNCGGRRGQNCLNSAFGNCCSRYGYCGSSTDYCGEGCQSRFGNCNSAQPSLTPTPPSTLKVSTNGSCGKGVTCLGSQFGDCCSQHCYCGSTKEYCNAGCQDAFGSCTETSLGDVSTNAQCGGAKGFICPGSGFGDCCSQYGYCGSSDAYCGTGYQAKFGNCNGDASTSTSSSTSSTSSESPSTSSTATESSSTSESSTSTTTTSETTISSDSSTSTPAPTSSELPTTTVASSTSTSSAPATPTCATNLVPNGGFEDGSLQPFSSNIVAGQATLNIPLNGNNRFLPDTGSRFLNILTTTSLIVTLTVRATNVRAGDRVICNARYNYPGDDDALLQAVQVVMYVDGQFCGQDQSFITNDWQSVTGSGPVTISNDEPVFQVSMYFDNFFGCQLWGALDNLGLVSVDEAQLPLCAETVQAPI